MRQSEEQEPFEGEGLANSGYHNQSLLYVRNTMIPYPSVPFWHGFLFVHDWGYMNFSLIEQL